MPFRTTNTPDSFLEFRNNARQQFLDIICTELLKNILIYTKHLKVYQEPINTVMKRLTYEDVFIIARMYKLYQNEVKYLELIIAVNRVQIDMEKVNAVKLWEEPGKVKEVEAFLRLPNCYQRFVHNYT
ncbi:hypothetical protein K440DRAFT_572101 [Wilcoxina mikolae CBS 423.85]|nr:hypothetical protein K440DRAFT_572101 [Wilcoxina mikolae CBS 423.85]